MVKMPVTFQAVKKVWIFRPAESVLISQERKHVTEIRYKEYQIMLTSEKLNNLIPIILYKVVQIWPGLIVCKLVTVRPGHIWTTLYINVNNTHLHV
jgi:hypothetical protein